MDVNKPVASRGNPKLPAYTKAENEAIRRLWPRGTTEELLEALPNRKMTNLRFQAMKLGVKCEVYRGGGLRFAAARAVGQPIKRADEYTRPQPTPVAKKELRKEEQPLVVDITAAELRRLSATHPGRIAYTQAARQGGAAAQAAFRKWQQSQQAT